MRARLFERTVAELEARLHRSPTDDEVADEMGMDVEEIRKFLGQLSLVNVVALDELLTDEDGGGAPRLGDTLQDTSALDPQAMAEHGRSEEHTSELQSRQYLVCRLLLEKKKKPNNVPS